VNDFEPSVGKKVEAVMAGRAATCHLPMANIAAANEKKRKQNVQEVIDSMEFGLERGVTGFVLHLCANDARYPLSRPGASDPVKAVVSVGDITDHFGRDIYTIALENLTRNEALFQNPETFSYLFHMKRIGLALDVLHAASWGLDPVHLAEVYKIECLEVHIAGGNAKQGASVQKKVKHCALGVGDVPTEDVLAVLGKNGYTGPVIIEVESKQDLTASIEWMRTRQY